MKKYLGHAVLIIAGAIALRSLLPPRTETIVAPPRIRTQYDTVRVLDTAWVEWLIERTRWDTVYTERVVVAAPETVTVIPYRNGLTQLLVPQLAGDSTLATGFTLQPGDSGAAVLRPWYAQWWTPGPLRAISTDTFPPRIDFWPAPKKVKGCGLFCKVGHYAVGGSIGYATCQLTR